MSADSEKPNIIGGNWTKYCTVANLWVGVGRFERRPRVRRLRSAAGSFNSGRHILESRCAERCANDAFSTSFRATLMWGQNVFFDENDSSVSSLCSISNSSKV